MFPHGDMVNTSGEVGKGAMVITEFQVSDDTTHC